MIHASNKFIKRKKPAPSRVGGTYHVETLLSSWFVGLIAQTHVRWEGKNKKSERRAPSAEPRRRKISWSSETPGSPSPWQSRAKPAPRSTARLMHRIGSEQKGFFGSSLGVFFGSEKWLWLTKPEFQHGLVSEHMDQNLRFVSSV